MYIREGIGLLLLLLGLLRATFLVTPDPLIGYANQYDMLRTGACIGLFPDVAEPFRANPDAPVALFRREAAKHSGCYPSSEVALASIVLGATYASRTDGKGIPLHWFGYAKLALLFATAIVIAWALHHHPGASLVHGAIVLLVITDPVVTLWFNTLYTEFFVIWGLYAAIGALCALAIAERGAIALWALLAVALVALAFAREQFALLAPALVAVAWPWLWYRSRAMTVAIFAIAVIASVISFVFTARPPVVQQVNRVDTYLGLVAPASADPARTLAALGLPEHCAPVIGATWYQQGGESVEKACPEVLALSSFAFLRLAREEPETLGRSIARVLPAGQAVSIGYLGTKADAKGIPIGELPWWAFSPLDRLVKLLPTAAFVPLALAVMLLAPLSLLLAIAWASPSSAHVGSAYLLGMLLGGTVLYTLVTTAFGDGLSEAPRHFLPGSLAIYSTLVAVLVGAPFLIGRWKEAPAKRIAMEAIVGAAAIATVAFACVTAIAWAGGQPLAIGVVEQPAARQVPGAGLRVSGWTLDPSGVESVRVQLGKATKTARFGDARPDIESLYPGYPDAARAWFAIEFTKEELAQAGAPGELPLRVVVKSRGGTETEIGRRRVEVLPD